MIKRPTQQTRRQIETIVESRRPFELVAESATSPNILAQIITIQRDIWSDFIVNLVLAVGILILAGLAVRVGWRWLGEFEFKMEVIVFIFFCGMSIALWRLLPSLNALTVGREDMTALRHLLYGDNEPVIINVPPEEDIDDDFLTIRYLDGTEEVVNKFDEKIAVLGYPFPVRMRLQIMHVLNFINQANQIGLARSNWIQAGQPRRQIGDAAFPSQMIEVTRDVYDAIINGLRQLQHPDGETEGVIISGPRGHEWSEGWTRPDLIRALTNSLKEIKITR